MNVKLAIALNQDITVSEEEVANSDVSLALIRSGDRPVALIAKAFSEYGKDKWISADKAMLIIEHGRVVRTLGFANDQVAIHSGKVDPLSQPSTIDGKSWSRLIDWSIGEYGYESVSSFTMSYEPVTVFNKTIDALRVTEIVSQKNRKALFSDESVWTNEFWFERNSSILLKTSQQASPTSDKFEIEFVSNILALSKGK